MSDTPMFPFVSIAELAALLQHYKAEGIYQGGTSKDTCEILVRAGYFGPAVVAGGMVWLQRQEVIDAACRLLSDKRDPRKVSVDAHDAYVASEAKATADRERQWREREAFRSSPEGKRAEAEAERAAEQEKHADVAGTRAARVKVLFAGNGSQVRQEALAPNEVNVDAVIAADPHTRGKPRVGYSPRRENRS